MTDMTFATLLAQLSLDEDNAGVELFGYAEARKLGEWVIARGTRDSLPIAVTVLLGEQRVFHGALPGTSHDNDLWLDRKVNVVRMYGRSSFYVKNLFAQDGRDFAAVSLHDPHVIMAAGGGFPIRIRGSLVGVIAISGWHEAGEHQLAVAALLGLGSDEDNDQ